MVFYYSHIEQLPLLYHAYVLSFLTNVIPEQVTGFVGNSFLKPSLSDANYVDIFITD